MNIALEKININLYNTLLYDTIDTQHIKSLQDYKTFVINTFTKYPPSILCTEFEDDEWGMNISNIKINEETTFIFSNTLKCVHKYDTQTREYIKCIHDYFIRHNILGLKIKHKMIEDKENSIYVVIFAFKVL